jgi:hypothetical protein
LKVSANTIELLKKNVNTGDEIWIYTRSGTGGGNGQLVEITDELIIVESIYRGKKYKHYFIIDAIESIKVYPKE